MTPRQMAEIAARAYRHMAPWSEQEFTDTLARPHALLLATDHAFVLGLVVADEAEVLALATDPDHQRGGAASALLADFHTRALARGATTVFLEVAAANEPARAFYDRHGYRQAGLRKRYYALADGSKDDALVLNRALP